MRLKNFTADPTPGTALFRAVRRNRVTRVERATVRETTPSHIVLDLDNNSGTERLPRSYPGLWFDSLENACANLTKRERQKRAERAARIRRSAFGKAVLLSALPTSPTTH